ncbi:uncharacterized protein LOC135806305 [Sycon ciliatum]|uniref:uncharacterized protein LOC135806305 n=1 Tax=Sycon ciliatum TaxID=27933 RepID=UPI0020AA7A80|eukprot:scpid46493/ scgid31931/ 
MAGSAGERMELHVGDDITVKIEQIQKDPHLIIASLAFGSKIFRGVLMDSDSVGDLRAKQESEIKSRECFIVNETPSVEVKSWDDYVDGMTRKRGRKAAWKSFHPEAGPCSTCSVCHSSGATSTFTHPALWRNVPADGYKMFNIEPESCVCHHCYTTRIKRASSAALTSLRMNCQTPSSVGSSSEDGRPEGKRKSTGLPLYEAKRGRCHHWRTVHPKRGACTICHVCGKSPEPARLTHPMSWHAGLNQEALRIGLGQTSCVCYPCHDLLRYASIAPGDVAIPGMQIGACGSDQSDGNSTSPISVMIDNCIPYDSPRKSSSSEQSDDNGDTFKDYHPEEMDMEVHGVHDMCHIPSCSSSIYCNMKYASKSMVAAVFNCNESELATSPASDVFMCVTHYHACERKLKELPCIYCQNIPSPISPQSPYTNVTQMQYFLKSMGRPTSFSPLAKICDMCFSQRMQQFGGQRSSGVSCSVQTCHL